MAEADPLCTPKDDPVRTPLLPVMEPLVSVTAPTVSLKVVRLRVAPLLIFTAPLSAKTLLTPKATVPWVIAVPPV